MFCKDIQPGIKRLVTLAKIKAVANLVEVMEQSGRILIKMVESEGTTRLVEMTATMDDNHLRDAVLKGAFNMISTSAYMKECDKIADPDARWECYRQGMRQFDKNIWVHEVGLYVSRIIQQVLAEYYGIKVNLSEAKALLEAFIASKKK